MTKCYFAKLMVMVWGRLEMTCRRDFVARPNRRRWWVCIYLDLGFGIPTYRNSTLADKVTRDAFLFALAEGGGYKARRDTELDETVTRSRTTR